MSTGLQRKLTPAEYLAIERAGDTKHEFVGGEMFAMAGANRKHNRITIDILRELGNQLEGGPCEPLGGDMRVKVSPTGLYTYPDIVVVCDEPQFEDAEVDTLLNPLLIVEVLSKSTEHYDRGGKFEQYRTLDTFREYLLVATNRCHAEHYVRQSDRTWQLTEYDHLSDRICFATIDAMLELVRAYQRVEVPDGPIKIAPLE